MAAIRTFITGAGGFIGSYLVEFLSGKGYDVHGTYYMKTDLMNEVKDKATFVQCDVKNRNKLKEIISKINPQQIYHLAAQSFPEISRIKPHHTIETNSTGTLNLLLAVKELKLNCRILNAGSSAEYGFVKPNRIPVDELHSLHPLHIYGITKVDQENLAYVYHKSDGLDCFTMRIFNTTGPRKTGNVCADFTRQVAAINLGLQNPAIRVGALDKKRAIMDVHDIINGFYLAMEKAKAGEAYNICGPKPYSIEDVLNLSLAHCKNKPEIVKDETLMRPTDEPIIFGSSKKFCKMTGWEAKIPLETTIKDMVEYWTEKLQKPKDSTQSL